MQKQLFLEDFNVKKVGDGGGEEVEKIFGENDYAC
jgi:hypothetical protein